MIAWRGSKGNKTIISDIQLMGSLRSQFIGVKVLTNKIKIYCGGMFYVNLTKTTSCQ